MDYVEYSTACKLQARFSEQQPEFGQVWYYTDTITHEVKPVLVGSALWNLIEGQTKIFAPKATDILKNLHFFDLHFDYKRQEWCCWDIKRDDKNNFHHKNPAEACAAAMLQPSFSL